MEYEQTLQTEEEVVYELPKWARILFRFYATIIIGIVAICLVRLFFLVLGVLSEVSLNQGLMFVAFLGLIIVSIAVTTIYGYSLFRLRRWTVIPSCFVAVNACLYLYIFTTLPPVHPVIGVIAVGFNILSISIAVTSVWFRSLLSESSKTIGIIFGTLFVLLLLPYFLYGIASIIIQDYKTVNDSDLILESIPLLPQTDNAHFYLPDTDTLDGTKAEQYKLALDIARAVSYDELNIDQAKIAVNETKTLTDAFITASKQKAYQCPTSVNKHGFDTSLCSLNDISDLGMLTTLRAEVALSEGDVEEAAKSSLAIVKMAHHMEASHQTLIEYLVAIALYSMAAESLDEIVGFYSNQDNSRIQLTATTSPALSDAPNTILLMIQNYLPDHTKLSTSYKAEYMVYKNNFADKSITESELGFELKESYLWQPNRTMDIMSGLTRKHISYANLECDEGEEFALDVQNDVHKLMVIQPLDYIKPNIIGRVLLSASAASLTNVRDKVCAVEQQYKELETEFENIVINNS